MRLKFEPEMGSKQPESLKKELYLQKFYEWREKRNGNQCSISNNLTKMNEESVMKSNEPSGCRVQSRDKESITNKNKELYKGKGLMRKHLKSKEEFNCLNPKSRRRETFTAIQNTKVLHTRSRRSEIPVPQKTKVNCIYKPKSTSTLKQMQCDRNKRDVKQVTAAKPTNILPAKKRPMVPTSSKMPYIRQTKTSLARLAMIPNCSNEYLAAHSQLKERPVQTRQISCTKPRIIKPRSKTEVNVCRSNSTIDRRKSRSAMNKENHRRVPKTQESLRGELENWLMSKGKTPSRCRHMMCHGLPGKNERRLTQKRVLSVDELSAQQEAMKLEGEEKPEMDINTKLRLMFEEFQGMLSLNCPDHLLLSWLANIEKQFPSSINMAEYWICKARVTMATGNGSHALELLEKAVQQEAKPSDVIAKELTAMVKQMTESTYCYQTDGDDVDVSHTAQDKNINVKDRTRAFLPLVNDEELPRSPVPSNVFQSSAVKLCVKEKTPLLKRMGRSLGSEMASPFVVTPVRRSTRRSLAQIPEFLSEKDRVYNRMSEIPEADQQRSLYQDNPALFHFRSPIQ